MKSLILQNLGYLFLKKRKENATENNYFHLEIRIFSYFRPWYFTQKYTNDR